MEYSDLDKNFKKPKDWTPAVQSFFRGPRFPRKLKKEASKLDFPFLTLQQKLWYLQGLKSPNYNRFLIKLICQSQKSI